MKGSVLLTMNLKTLKRNSNKLGRYDAHFLMKLADLTESGFTMHNALIFLLEQYDVLKAKDKEDCLEMAGAGGSLSSILRRLGYKNSIIIQISFAEIHGELLTNLRQSALYLENMRETAKKLLKAIQYPLVLIGIFITMLVVLNYTVIPQFESLYGAMGTESDGFVTFLTQFLQRLPQLVFGFLLLMAVFILSVCLVMKMPDIRLRCRILLATPLIKYYFSGYQTYRFSREFGFFINNGLEVKEILDLFNHQTLNDYLSYTSSLIEQKLIQGENLSTAIKSIKMLDEKLSVFVSHGEQNSSVGKELILFSEYTLERLIMKIENVTKKIQPVIFLILGLLIICLYLVIVLPVFEMMSEIN
ncbi:competence type IV pilus assembly protein ComGB [Salinicoccus albus]|uniref:competence type IV pilus assembly protein ComGB n=1 Tax=Salinicoccus albus TaxID=418756 RepID=UPI0012E9C845|nr:competence type IV pilus assembly protein ComGB [Salinicoccus albus]